MKCERCGGPTLALFTSVVCKRDCSNRPAELKPSEHATAWLWHLKFGERGTIPAHKLHAAVSLESNFEAAFRPYPHWSVTTLEIRDPASEEKKVYALQPLGLSGGMIKVRLIEHDRGAPSGVGAR